MWAKKQQNFVSDFFFDRSLTGNLYLNMLQNDIENLIDDLPLNEAQGLIFQQDGVPAHCVGAVTNFFK